MNRSATLWITLFLVKGALINIAYAKIPFSWLSAYDSTESIKYRIPVPDGYLRIRVKGGSFTDWLRNLPLKDDDALVYLYDGRKKHNQNAHHKVIDIDVGRKNLQQCADAVIRLRAEYLFYRGDHNGIHFNFTSGDPAEYGKWCDGYRPVVQGSVVRWLKSAERDSSYANFKKYLESVFIYAGSYSLQRELLPVSRIDDMQIGDVFIQGGFPGHAVIVVDMAEDVRTGKKIFLLAQSYMPAQDIHVLKNPDDGALSPWYELDFGDTLITPEWIFHKNNLMRFAK